MIGRFCQCRLGGEVGQLGSDCGQALRRSGKFMGMQLLGRNGRQGNHVGSAGHYAHWRSMSLLDLLTRLSVSLIRWRTDSLSDGHGGEQILGVYQVHGANPRNSCQYLSLLAEEPGLWSELSDDTDLVRGRDVIIRGYRWMVRNCQK